MTIHLIISKRAFMWLHGRYHSSHNLTNFHNRSSLELRVSYNWLWNFFCCPLLLCLESNMFLQNRFKRSDFEKFPYWSKNELNIIASCIAGEYLLYECFKVHMLSLFIKLFRVNDLFLFFIPISSLITIVT